MATSLGIANGSATPNKTGEKGNVTTSSANTSSGALSDGSTANPTATTDGADDGGENDDETFV